MLFKSKIKLYKAIKLLNIKTLKHTCKALIYTQLALTTSNIKTALNYLKDLANN